MLTKAGVAAGFRFVLLLSLALAAGGATVPRPAPAIAGQATSGQAFRLADYKGKVVALALVITTCPHCQHTAEMLERLQTEWKSRGFQPVALAFDDMARMLAPDFAKNHKLTFPVVPVPRSVVEDLLQHNKDLRLLVPQMVLVDRQGQIRFQTPSEGDPRVGDEAKLRELIEPLLKEPAARP